LPGPHSKTWVTPGSLHRLHGFDPTHRRRSLAHQGITDRGGIGELGDIDVVDHREFAAKLSVNGRKVRS
jgi:hypothetical protein